ncbi:ribosomal 40S subunit protein S24B [Tritrichomonas musculus]|uniref:Ribosomal 40S subunit protein S24B n=1 Tax=Tritrichomonas musculus TaxID=1915356 RepID=A0ABR2KQ85_9EUKA
MSKATLRIRKYIVNKLLDRKQFVVDLKHPGDKAPTRDEIKDLVSAQLKANKENIVIFQLKTLYGGGHTTGFGLIYDNKDSMLKIEPDHRLIKAHLKEKSKQTRRSRKNTRKQKMKVWGTGVRATNHKTRRQQRKEELGGA